MLLSRIRRWPTATTVSRGLTFIVGGSLAGQGVVMLGYPLVTRLYTPADFGLLSVFSSVVSIIAVLSTGTLETATPIPVEEDEATAVAWSALACVGLTTVLTTAAWPVAGPLARLLGVPALARLWWLVPLTVLALGVYQVFSTWMIRQRTYGALGRRNLCQGISQVGTQAALGWFGVGPVGLLLGLGVGRFCAVGGMRCRDGLLRRPVPKLGRLVAAVYRFRQFPLLAAPSALLNSAGLNVPILVISALYGDARAGLLGLTVRVIGTPSTVIGQAVSQVFTGESGARLRQPNGSVGSLLRATTVRLAALGAIPAVVVAIAGPEMFGFVFGSHWAEAGRYAQILTLAYLAGFVFAPLAPTLQLLECQGQMLAWSTARLVLTTAGPLVCGLLKLPIMTAVATFSCGHVVGYLMLYLLCLRAAARRNRVDQES